MNVLSGDLLSLAEDGLFDVLIHGCNCHNNFGAGLAKQIKIQYPGAYAEDCKTIRGDRFKVGTYTAHDTGKFIIINAYTQYDISCGGDVFEYSSFSEILENLLVSYGTLRFGFPLIGCGLACGNESRILSMIEDFSKQVEIVGGNVTLVKFG